MPGPSESSLTINSYLSPLVEKLNEFWKGMLIPIKCGEVNINMKVRLAITCVSCDIPASRKVCGFLGHFAKLGCNKCLKEFKQHDMIGKIGRCDQIRIIKSSVRRYSRKKQKVPFSNKRASMVFDILSFWYCNILIQSNLM